MAKEPASDAMSRPASTKTDPYLYGGVAAIAGIIGILAGGVIALTGNATSGGILSALGAVLVLAGFLVARRGH